MFINSTKKKKTLQSGLFKSYLLLAMTIVAGFAVFFYQYTSAILINRETENLISQTSHMQVQTDQAIRTLDNLSINIGYSNVVMSNLEEYFSDDEPDLNQTRRLADLFVAINGTEVQADQINIFSFSGQQIGFGYVNNSSIIDLREQNWYKPTLELAGHKYIPAPYSTDLLSKSSKANIYYLSLYRTYYNRYGRQVGIIETMMRCNTVFKSIISLQNSDAGAPDIFVFNEKGTLIYPFKEDEQILLHTPQQYLQLIESAAGSSATRNANTEAREIVTYQKSDYTSWTYVSVMPEHQVLSPVRRLTALLAAAILILLGLAAAMSYSMSYRLARPIRQLRSIIHKTELNTLDDQTKQPLDDGFEEVEELNQSFSDLRDKLKISMDQALYSKHQEMKARMVALQSQINPHFYYNSLSSIIILAENKQCEEVVKLSRNLNGIMRYISRGSSTVVTMREELDYLDKYLYCMKIRYQSSLSYQIDVSEELSEQAIPKLIIQPLVENALKYGTDCYPPWKITVTGRPLPSSTEDNSKPLNWLIEVTDSGPGFPEEIITTLNNRMQEIDNTDGLPPIDIDGMGLANVYARWKLHAGARAYFSCENLPDGGARVRIGLTEPGLAQNLPDTLY